MGYLKSTGTVFIYIGLFLGLLAFLPGIPPNAQFSEFSIVLPQTGLVNNPKYLTRLDDAEILFRGEIKGPESFASYNGELYTTLHGGDVVKIVGKHIVPVVKFGKPCDGIWMEQECGRPLGLHFDKNGVLYVIDTYYGIFKVDVTSGKYEKLVDIFKPIEGVIPKLANNLDIASNGDIYWTHSSSKFNLQDGIYGVLENPSGRLIKYDAATKKNTVLLDNLCFANGVKLSKDESFVIVSETLASRLTKFNLRGDNAGKAEPFVQGLPGLPDNIHTDNEDGFLISLVDITDDEHPCIGHSLQPHPNIRKMLARLLYLLEAPFKLIEDIYPNYYSKRIVHWIGHFESIHHLYSESASVLRINSAGKIIDAAFSFDGKISTISSAYIFKDYVYLGSPYNAYLARVPLSQAFPSVKQKLENIVREKVIEKRDVKELPETTTTPVPSTTNTVPKPVVTRPKLTSATTPQPATDSPMTLPPLSKQQQQQKMPKPTAASRESSPKVTQKVSALPPPSPSKEAQASKPILAQQGGQKPIGQLATQQSPLKTESNEKFAKSGKKSEDAPKKSELTPSISQKSPPPGNAKTSQPQDNAQKSPPLRNASSKPKQNNSPKPSKPVPVTSENIKVTNAKKTEQTAKPLVAAPPLPRD